MSATTNHPWRSSGFNHLKLKAAKAEAKRIYERTNKARNDEYRLLKKRESDRKRHGIPVDLPLMKCWDYKTGRVSKPAGTNE